MGYSISFRCGGCNARIKAPSQLRGRTRACPGCGHRLVVQTAPPRDEGPVLMSDPQISLRHLDRRRY
jgi:DNA-directed RNA polymerase subunit RPC12/RpoP